MSSHQKLPQNREKKCQNLDVLLWWCLKSGQSYLAIAFLIWQEIRVNVVYPVTLFVTLFLHFTGSTLQKVFTVTVGESAPQQISEGTRRIPAGS